MSITYETQASVLKSLSATRSLPVQHAWPPDLFKAAEEELEELIRSQYMPQFIEHPIFEHLLTMIGNYDANNLFPPEQLEHAASHIRTYSVCKAAWQVAKARRALRDPLYAGRVLEEEYPCRTSNPGVGPYPRCTYIGTLT